MSSGCQNYITQIRKFQILLLLFVPFQIFRSSRFYCFFLCQDFQIYFTQFWFGIPANFPVEFQFFFQDRKTHSIDKGSVFIWNSPYKDKSETIWFAKWCCMLSPSTIQLCWGETLLCLVRKSFKLKLRQLVQ